MRRRLAILGLLSLTACPIIEEDPLTPELTGTVQGALTPFQGQSASVRTTPSPLETGDRSLSRAVVGALASKGVLRTGLPERPLSARESIIPGEVIVRFEEANLPVETALSRARAPGYRAVHRGRLSEHLHLIRYEPTEVKAWSRPDAREVESVGALTSAEHTALVQQLSAVPGVRYAESNLRVKAFSVPNDPLYSRQWHYPGMNLPAAWDITTGLDSMVVAVVDTGIVRHPDLDSRVIAGMDLISDPANAGDGNGVDNDPTDMGKDSPNGGSSYHGTHVAGTIGAVSNNGLGVAGVTWRGKVQPVRVLGASGGSMADIAAGMNWASGGSVPGVPVNPTPARVVNLSLGGTGTVPQSIQELVNAGVARGSVFVIAAGNENRDATNTFPCNMQNVICVGSVRFDGKRSGFSNYGPPVDVMAAGGQTSEDRNGDSYPDGVLSTLMDARNQPSYEWYNGTSMAAPHVAGIVALMLAVNPSLTFAQVEAILKETADTSSRCAEGCGAGLVNAQAAVLRAKGSSGTEVAPKLGVGSTQLSFSAGGSQQLSVRNLGGGTLQASASVTGAQASSVSLSSRTLSIPAYGSVPLTVSVNPGSLPNGSYVAQLSLRATTGTGSADVLVKFRVGASLDKDAVIAFAYKTLLGEWKVDDEGVALVPAARGYAYSISLPPRTYFALATIDDDGDNEFFEEGERVGFWRDATAFEALDVKRDQAIRDVSFTLVPYRPVEEAPEPVVGKPCTSDGQCGTAGLCVTASQGYPGGYCTLECLTAACPVGSKCYANTEGTEAYCYATCTGMGSQGTCRTGYVCYDDGAGGGACDIP
ncbi:serine protease [Archangium gephyra]|uniref:Serine protease n=1 Tax=Archangium gephyra TaxID=48 RepID=A0AAC8Q3J6_9BACT|nr:S8 family serine peptidase [Archangium gephyra]AKJ00438.1 Extracellular serine protease [Archangium gephyra]REG32864.1 serine protease [Archangium gephyra]